MSQLPLIGLTDANKKISFINKRLGKGRREKNGFSRVEICKRLLRNEVNKAITDGARQRGRKGKSHGTH